jgi:hypothetical protein
MMHVIRDRDSAHEPDAPFAYAGEDPVVRAQAERRAHDGGLFADRGVVRGDLLRALEQDEPRGEEPQADHVLLRGRKRLAHPRNLRGLLHRAHLTRTTLDVKQTGP